MSWSSFVVWFISGRTIERMETKFEEMGGAINGMLVKENQNHRIQRSEKPQTMPSPRSFSFGNFWGWCGAMNLKEKKNVR